MLFKGNKTKEQELIRRANRIKGRTNREKFAWQLKEILKVLYKIKELDRIQDTAIEQAIDRLRDDYEDQTVTTSEEKILLYAIACYDDAAKLLDDMMHQVAGASYVPRLQNILSFVADFNNKPYDEYVVFYEATSDKLIDRVKAVTKDVQYKVSRLNYEIAKQSDEVIAFEDLNVQRIKAMKELPKSSYRYTEQANLISDTHNQIEMLKGTINMTRKSASAFGFLARMLEQLTLHEDYFHYIKEDGYLRRLIKRLYKKPQELDVMDNILDLTEVLNNLRDEIAEIESMVKPAQKMVFEDPNNDFDEDVLRLYERMAQEE
jgi:phosphoglycerate-specific signal transduction histidine kinase